MRKHPYLPAAVAAMFIACTPAHAGSMIYTGAGLGMLEMDGGAGQKAGFAGYVKLGSDFMPYLGAEIRLGTGTKATKNNEKMQMDWMVAHFLKPYIDIGDVVRLYALGGFTINHTSLRIGTASKQRKTNISLSYGGGMRVALSHSLKLGVEWVRYANDADPTSRATSFQGLNLTGYMATLTYSFPEPVPAVAQPTGDDSPYLTDSPETGTSGSTTQSTAP